MRSSRRRFGENIPTRSSFATCARSATTPRRDRPISQQRHGNTLAAAAGERDGVPAPCLRRCRPSPPATRDRTAKSPSPFNVRRQPAPWARLWTESGRRCSSRAIASFEESETWAGWGLERKAQLLGGERSNIAKSQPKTTFNANNAERSPDQPTRFRVPSENYCRAMSRWTPLFYVLFSLRSAFLSLPSTFFYFNVLLMVRVTEACASLPLRAGR